MSGFDQIRERAAFSVGKFQHQLVLVQTAGNRRVRRYRSDAGELARQIGLGESDS